MKHNHLPWLLIALSASVIFGDRAGAQTVAAEQWKPVELTFTSAQDYSNPYTDVSLSVEFTGPNHVQVHRPAFWDGGRIWRARFAPLIVGQWTWRSVCSQPSDSGLDGKDGSLEATAYTGSNPLLKHGLLGMLAGLRNVIHADGTPFLVVGDTAWSLPWRGTIESVGVYADDRQSKGFDAVLLMSIQPDRRATGPRDRTSVGGFDVGFEDLPSGHINQMNVSYFQYMDKLMSILMDHGIVPVYQPFFKGLEGKDLARWAAMRCPQNTLDTAGISWHALARRRLSGWLARIAPGLSQVSRRAASKFIKKMLITSRWGSTIARRMARIPAIQMGMAIVRIRTRIGSIFSGARRGIMEFIM